MRRTIFVLSLLAGCTPSVGPADEDAALEIVYDRDGVPVFAGQALAIQSCGAGGFCHSDGIEAADRFGAPSGLGFDMRVASTTVEIEEEAAERLLAHQSNILNNRGLVWAQVSSLRMPPSGAVGEEYRSSVEGLTYERFDAAGEFIGPLPGLDTEEGREIFRNWLAARAPVIERTQTRVDRQPNLTGYTVPLCERTCVDPTWESIYVQIVQPSCALSRCHDGSDPAADLDLYADLSVPAPQSALTPEQLRARVTPVLERIVGTAAQGSQCRPNGHVVVTAGEPESSLMYLKVAPARRFETADTCAEDVDCEALTPPAECRDTGGQSAWECSSGRCTFACDVCGGSMPLSGNPLTEQRLCALREWIACGACAPDDRSCDACIETARDTCGVGAPFDLAEGAAQCAVQQPCMNRP